MVNNFVFNYYSISLLMGGVIAVISGFIVYLNNKSRAENQAWLLLTITTAIWSFSYFQMISTTNQDTALLFNYILHIAAIAIPTSYLLLVLIMTGFIKNFKYTYYSILGVMFGFMAITKSTLFVSEVVPKVSFNYAPVPGILYKYFFAYFVIIVTFGIVLSLLKIKESSKEERFRFIYLIYFTLFASIGGGSVFITTFIPTIPPYLICLFSIYPFVSGYGILKHQLFDTRVVTGQLITFSLWIVILIRVLLSNSQIDLIVNIIFFIISLIFGTLLIRSISKEITIKEALAKSNDKLEDANVHLKELDQKKSEFMSLATHQLRAPLTAMRGYYSMIQDGSFGKIDNPELEDVINKISRSTTDLTMIVEDYLNISRIEQGRMQYNFVTIDIADVVRGVVKEVSPTVKHAGITLNLTLDETQKYMVSVDQGKIKQVIFNIIDNSIKYTPKGSVNVSIEKTKNKKVIISVKDTGVGIKAGVIPQLFQKFTRAPDASDTNILGTGLGLYVADQILKAHDGRAWAESEGQGKGAQFYIEIGLNE
jgi:signal transduction histidine kinase